MNDHWDNRGPYTGRQGLADFDALEQASEASRHYSTAAGAALSKPTGIDLGGMIPDLCLAPAGGRSLNPSLDVDLIVVFHLHR